MTQSQWKSALLRWVVCQCFHEEAKIEQSQGELAMEQVSYIPEESAGLRDLGQVNQDVVRELGRRGGQN